MAFSASDLQIAGIAVFIVILLATGWWVVRTAMGWHRGSTFAWFHPRQDEEGDELDEDDEHDNGGDAR
jgi:hypothetical protein